MELIGFVIVLVIVGLSYASGYMNGHTDGCYDTVEAQLNADDVFLSMPAAADDNEQAPRTSVRPF